MLFRIFILFFLLSSNLFCQISFIENKGQIIDKIKYYGDIHSGKVFLESNSITYNFYDQKRFSSFHEKREKLDNISGHSYRVVFKNANKNVNVTGYSKTKNYYNFYHGNDKTSYKSKVDAFYSVIYSSIYENIDINFYSQHNNLKYDFIIKPGGDIKDIKLSYQGISPNVDKRNDLNIDLDFLLIKESKPLVYQLIKGDTVFIDCEYKLQNDIVSFNVKSSYNKKHDLVIDPIVFSTYSGSYSNNFGYSSTYDELGFLYSAGTTFDIGYPTTVGAYQTNFAGGSNMFVGFGTDIVISKYDTSGSFLVYSTYLGGSGDEVPHSLVCSRGELYLLGTTGSNDFPISQGSFDPSFNGGLPFTPNGIGVTYNNGSDIIITKFNYSGSNLLGSTYFGGIYNDGLNTSNQLKFNYADEIRGEIDIDNDGYVYIASCTRSGDLPMLNSFQGSFNGGLDGFVAKFSNNLQTLIWSTYIGGSMDDALYSLAFNKQGDVFVCGGTVSSNLVVQPNSYQSSNNGGIADACIFRLDNNGNYITSTYYGSDKYDQSYFIDLDQEYNVFVFGQTKASGFTFVQNANFFQANSGQFVSKFDPDLTNLEMSTVFGSGSQTPDIAPTAFLVDVCNRIYISGWGGLTNAAPYGGGGNTGSLLVTSDAVQTNTDSSDFYILIMEEDASSLTYATFYGGNISAEHVDGGTSRFDKKGIIYQSVCAGCQANSDFPTTPNAHSNTNNSFGCNNAVFKFNPDLPLTISDFFIPDISCNNTIDFNNYSIGSDSTFYIWDMGDGTFYFDRNPTHTYLDTGQYIVTLITDDSQSCNLRDTSSHTIIIRDNKIILSDTLDICFGEQILLDNGSVFYDDFNSTYQWFVNSQIHSNTNSSFNVNPEDTTDYLLIVSFENCIDSILSNIRVKKVNFNVTQDTSICLNDVVLYAQGTDTTSFIWSYNSNISNPFSSADSVIVSFPGVLYLQATENGCTDIKEININLSENCCSGENIIIPNAFTPNSDGKNDVFKILDDFDLITDFEINIFNRWGEDVFSSFDKNFTWNGIYKEKKEITYVYDYFMDIECLDFERTFIKGNITIIK
ncbi:MAG: hypothetical protein CMP58_04755 [Flavobacteriales bacterium]|nr:hypothetical protein [Flavobacteriales bacterium]